MALFPFFMNIQEKTIFILGGGKHAVEKVDKMLPYGAKLWIFSDRASEELERLSEEHVEQVHILYRKVCETDLDTLPFCVIAAGDDREENRRISKLCRERRIPVNVVDDQEYCDFIFPSLVLRGNLSVGICTNGASPSTGVLLKRKMEEQIPEHIEEILDWLQEKRPVIMKMIPDKKQRFGFYYELSELCMKLDRPLTEEEFVKRIKEPASCGEERVKETEDELYDQSR